MVGQTPQPSRGLSPQRGHARIHHWAQDEVAIRLPWRDAPLEQKYETSDLGRYDPEYARGISLGMRGTSADFALGMSGDVRVISDPDVSSTSFLPSEQLPDAIVTAPSEKVNDGLPEMPEI